MASLKDKLVSMKSEPTKKSTMPIDACCSDEDFPYGLRISLNESSLQKLGLSIKDFEIEGEIMIKAECNVTEVRSSKGNDYSSENVELQITKLAVSED
jgi:hypothetical protein